MCLKQKMTRHYLQETAGPKKCQAEEVEDSSMLDEPNLPPSLPKCKNEDKKARHPRTNPLVVVTSRLR
jgi:hypothetical protein